MPLFSKADMTLNDYRLHMEVNLETWRPGDLETDQVRADRQGLTCEPADALPITLGAISLI